MNLKNSLGVNEKEVDWPHDLIPYTIRDILVLCLWNFLNLNRMVMLIFALLEWQLLFSQLFTQHLEFGLLL